MDIGDILVARQLITPRDKVRLDSSLLAKPGGATSGRLFAEIKTVIGDQAAADAKRIEKRRQEVFRDSSRLEDSYKSAYSGEAVLFVGAGFSFPCVEDRNGHPNGESLKEFLIDDFKKDKSLKHLTEHQRSALRNSTLQDAAQALGSLLDPVQVHNSAAKWCRSRLPDEPEIQHGSLAAVNAFPYIITTNWDRLIERSFGKDRCTAVCSSHQVTHIRPGRTTLIKLHGDYDPEVHKFAATPRISSQEISRLKHDEPGLTKLVQSLFFTHDIVVIGFRPEDYNFLHFVAEARRSIGDHPRRVFIVDPSDYLQAHFTWGKTELITCDAIEYLDGLDAYFRCRGGANGRWHGGRGRKRKLGAIATFSQPLCEDARRLGELLKGTVQRIEVAGPDPGEKDATKQTVGRLAASVLMSEVTPESQVTFTCGSTLEALAEEANSDWERFRRVTLYAASVPIGERFVASAPISLAALFAKRLASLGVECRSYQLPGELLGEVIDPKFARFLPDESFSEGETAARRAVDSYLSAAAQSNVFAIGIGSTNAESGSGLWKYLESCIRSGSAYEEELDKSGFDSRLETYTRRLREMDELQFVGDLMYWLLKAIDKPLSPRARLENHFIDRDRLLTCLESKYADNPDFMEFLARAYCHVRSVRPSAVRAAAQDPERSVIAVACGAGKAEAAISASFTRMINTLVIDKALCDAMIRKLE